MPLPCLYDVAEVRRLYLAICPIRRDGNPRLSAARPDVPDRKEPAGVIEIACFHDGDPGIRAWLMKQPSAALCTDDAVDHAAALVLAFPYGRLAFIDNNRASIGKQ